MFLSSPVLFLIACRPPTFNKDLITDLADFLSCVIVKYDDLPIFDDVNIHVCCESTPLTNVFLNLIPLLNPVQSVKKPDPYTPLVRSWPLCVYG